MGSALPRRAAAIVIFSLLHATVAGATSEAGNDAAVRRRPLPPEIAPSQYQDTAMDLSEGPLRPPNWTSENKRIKLGASYNESISLKDVLDHVLKYNLPIKISRESWLYQRGQLLAAAAGFVPTYVSCYRATGVKVFPNTRAPSQVFVSEVRYPVFLGGAVINGALGQFYRDRAWKTAYQNTIDASLLDAYNKYADLVLHHMLLKIRRKSILLAEANLALNEANYRAGLATQFDVMQSRTQLAETKEQHYQQQLATRSSAMALGSIINAPLAINFIPREPSLKEAHLLSSTRGIADYEKLSLEKRPELRQYEQFRLAAARAVQGAAASFYPQVSLFTAFTVAATQINIPENVDLLNGVAAAEVAQAEENIGPVTNTALDQTASFSPGSANTANQGANTLTDVVAGSGGNPLANVQGGSLVTSGAVKPVFGSSAVTGAPTTSNIQGSDTASAGIFPGHSANFQMGMNLGWTLPNIGLSPLGSVLSARSLSKQAMMQANQQLLLVMKEVHAAFFGVQTARKRVEAAAAASNYGRETLKLARLRLQSGTGTNLELIEAHNDYIRALSSQARAITALNKAQAQLLKDVGIISVSALVDGYH
ncbi:MAG TPA: TolC family protein [Candidatus Obscuribacterales bacterium]